MLSYAMLPYTVIRYAKTKASLGQHFFMGASKQSQSIEQQAVKQGRGKGGLGQEDL